MKRPIFSAPDSFSALPLLALLPSFGKLSKLEALTSSLFARYENVVALQRGSAEIERDVARRLSAEESMLRQVLDWLQVKPEAEE